jgi:hypothetical protein
MMGVEDAKNPQPTMDGGSVGEIYDHGRDRFEGYPRLLQSYLEGVDYMTGENIMENENDDDQSKLIQKAMTTSQRQKIARDRIKTQGAEFTSIEQGIVDQLEEFISNLAAEPGVDLMKHRTLLQRILKLLQTQIKGTQ